MPKPVPMPVAFEDAAKRYCSTSMSMSDLRREFTVSLVTIKKWLASLGVVEKSLANVLSAQRIGKPSGGKGLKRSAETRAKMSAITKARSPTTQWFKFSDESKEKMRQAAKRRIAETDSLEKMQAGRLKLKLPENELIARAKSRDACKRMLRRILTMARVKKDGRRSELLLGYTKQDLRAHLESQFSDGMGWGARESFHIDHIKPVAQFFREGVTDPSVINALSNLQVLTPQENRAKGDRHISFSHRNRRQALIIDHGGTRPFQ